MKIICVIAIAGPVFVRALISPTQRQNQQRSTSRLVPHTAPHDEPRILKQRTSGTTNIPSLVASIPLALSLLGLTMAVSSSPAWADEGLSVVTQSSLGQSVRRSIVGGAKIADQWDLVWERWSDSRRDSNTCDPVTNRRRFDNGVRKDGTPIGNPVLGALCTPEPLLKLDADTARTILDLAQDAASESLHVKKDYLLSKQQKVQELVGPSFSRALTDLEEEATLRQDFNRDLYAQMRAYGDVVSQSTTKDAQSLERKWGEKMLETFAPQANRDNFKSPFPKPDPTEDQPYNEGALLDALGGISVALGKLQANGMIGRFEISIPEDDYWNVVTIAVDDDITMGGQILARERRQPLQGSPVVAMVRAAMESQANIPYKMTTYFIDPTTTKQELYNPTQLLISLNDLGQ